MRAIVARDLMNPEVLTVQDDMTVEELAGFLVDNAISGAPVEDGRGNLVGVVTLVDVAANAGGEGPKITPDRSNPNFFVRGWEDALDLEEMHRLRVEENHGHTVRDIMTPSIYAVTEEASVSEIASTMLDAHLHRLLVTDQGGKKVVGIITTSDLLGLLVDEKG